MNLKERFSESCLQFTQDQNLIENYGLRLKENILKKADIIIILNIWKYVL
jgi:hypothetical protein